MSGEIGTTIVIALNGREKNLIRLVAALEPAARDGIELIFACAGDCPKAVTERLPKSTFIRANADALIPNLWRDGIRAARSRRVALLTSECIPAEGWLEHVLTTDIERWAGVGGVLVNDPDSDALNWAVYLLRYIRFAPPMNGGRVDDIAADNAVYDRDAILAYPDLLDDGFWEPSFHVRFHEAGRELMLDPGMFVTHSGTNEAGPFLRHRFAHGREYGESRGMRSGIGKRLALLAASPALPVLILGRIVARSSSRGLVGPMIRSLPWLMLFVLAWAGGESRGYLGALLGSSKRIQDR